MLTVTQMVLLLKCCDLQGATKVHHHMTDTDCALQCSRWETTSHLYHYQQQRPWWYLYQRSYLIYHALTPNIEHELFLAPASGGMKINRPKYLHWPMDPCRPAGGWELLWWHCSTDTSGQCPHILVVWHCSWVTEAVYQPVNTAANLSQPTINTHAPG